MKLLVTADAFYGEKRLHEGDVELNYRGKKAPSWGKIIKDEAPVDTGLIEKLNDLKGIAVDLNVSIENESALTITEAIEAYEKAIEEKKAEAPADEVEEEMNEQWVESEEEVSEEQTEEIPEDAQAEAPADEVETSEEAPAEDEETKVKGRKQSK